ncbi:MAG: hypothetical protein GC184_15070 [Rhizobiales bacterium]|nr:hypothetical protein [Hyphomicrobiales bacterium]
MEQITASGQTPFLILIWASALLLLNTGSTSHVWHHVEARIILATVPLTLAVAWVLTTQYHHPLAWQLSHLIIWVPALICLIWTNPDIDYRSAFAPYLILTVILNLVTMGFDVLSIYRFYAGSAALA